MARLADLYKNEIVPKYMEMHGLKNIFQVPKLEKIVVNVGIGQKGQDAKVLESIQDGIAMITGQKPVLKRAKKAVSGFKVRKGMVCGCMVTLRRKMMYEFFDRLINFAIPRIRDFQGLSQKSFDEAGNYTFGLTEQAIFSEINPDKVAIIHGMDITIVTNAGSAKRAYDLLKLFGFPFKKK